VQRTIFELKNKKFVPKRIQYAVESTAASSCSLLASTKQYDESLSRNLFVSRSGKSTCQIGVGVLVQATPIKRDRQAPALATVKKQIDPFDSSGRFTRTTRASR